MNSRFQGAGLGLLAGFLFLTPAAFAQDSDEDLFDASELDYVEDDVAPDAVRVLPPGVILVRSEDGSFQPPFEQREACSGDWCGEIVIDSSTGRIVFAQGRWQPGAIETGYGLEVVVAVEP